ncbi:MAG: UvrD-helicase domain-containing protein [Bacteroidales bacterium]|nr:UvrD-helicase domain-containing protein [Bacteroidales bacterium]
MQTNFKIYDASAGSGKTFNLASNYIVTAMKSGFENILAVTFTNAAAKEMKDRIIDVLQNLSVGATDGETAGYKENIIRLYNNISAKDWEKYSKKWREEFIVKNEKVIQQKANEVLKQILHHYSFFNVSTIDSFFQLVLKNLTKELGVTGNYILALDSQKYDELAVKTLVNSEISDDNETPKIQDTNEHALNSNPSTLNWLLNFFIKSQEDGKSWNIEKTLNKFAAKAFKSDEVSSVLQSENNTLLSLENLENLRKQLAKEVKQFEKTLKEKKEAFIDKCKTLSLEAKDFKDGRKNGIYNYIIKMPEEITAIEELEERKTLPEVAEETYDIIDYLKENYNDFRLNKIYYNNIYQLGVLNNIAQIKSGILKKDNIFILNDTAYLLSKLNEGDVPFVFEKISQRIEHIFIDEFQDTSRSSYKNLKKLIDESLQTGGSSFIFGDIKQSIYRFNGGDFTILQKLTEDNSDSVIHLKENFRSLGNIVKFNNDLFKTIYENNGVNFVPQKVRRDDNIGIVRIKFTDSKDDIYNYIKHEINYYHSEKGYDLSDIALLFRSNDKLIDVANRLKNDTEFDYNPVSDIAFKFSSSLAVNKIVETLKYLDDSTKCISKEIINADDTAQKRLDDFARTSRKEKSLLEVVMKIANILQIDDDAVFLPAFYDTIKDYIKTRSGNLKEFLDYWQETLQERSVDMSGVKAGVRLTSIHKSKGLAYRVVIVPYCDNNFYKSENIWVKSDDATAKLPVFMTTASNLENTSYNDLFESEKHSQFMDTVNLLYVAFTRCRDNLSVISTVPSANALKSEPKALNALLFNYVTSVNPQDFADKGGNLFVYRNCEKTKSSNKISNTENNGEITVDKIELSDNNVVFSTSKEDELEEYFADTYNNLSQMELGTKYHSYISRLKRENDIENIILQAEKANEDTSVLREIFDTVIAQTEELHWYDNTYKILNERAVICFDNANELLIKRPDRVMYNDNEVIVVDYKFGKREEKYHKQVKQYMQLISQMEAFKNKNFIGYLYYINPENPTESTIEKC